MRKQGIPLAILARATEASVVRAIRQLLAAAPG